MPTPDDAIVSPVEHESIANRPTCPPEEARIVNTRDLNETRHLSANSNVDPVHDVPMQQPTPPPQDSPAHASVAPDIHSKPSGTDMEALARDIPTPMTAADDGDSEQRTTQASPLSASAPAPVSPFANHHLSSPFPAHRVRYADFDCDALDEWRMLMIRVVSPKFILIPPTPLEAVCCCVLYPQGAHFFLHVFRDGGADFHSCVERQRELGLGLISSVAEGGGLGERGPALTKYQSIWKLWRKSK